MMTITDSDIAAMRRVMKRLTRDRLANFQVTLGVLAEMCRQEGVCAGLPPLAGSGMEEAWHAAIGALTRRPSGKVRVFSPHRRRWKLRRAVNGNYWVERYAG